MALINITAGPGAITSLLTALDRIALALERMAGPGLEALPDTKKRGPDAIVQYGNGDREWAKEHFRKAVHEQGLPPEREEKLVGVAMKRYDYVTNHPEEE